MRRQVSCPVLSGRVRLLTNTIFRDNVESAEMTLRQTTATSGINLAIFMIKRYHCIQLFSASLGTRDQLMRMFTKE